MKLKILSSIIVLIIILSIVTETFFDIIRFFMWLFDSFLAGIAAFILVLLFLYIIFFGKNK